MKYTVEIDTNLGEVKIYNLADYCDDGSCGCTTWVGQFSFEKVENNVTIFSWNVQQYDVRALRSGVNYFITKYCKPNSIQKIFVERSHGDRVWELLGWEMIDKCLMLERAATLCT